ncbi:MAG: right-handed parallel beta-helix repeat-containing protein, partial [bacterium]
YSSIQGGWPGEGNIGGYPQFVDSANGNYRLRNGSPCIDTGLVSAAPSEDAEGRKRPGDDGFVDMGAYESPPEYEPGEESEPPSVIYVRSDAVPEGNGSSWDRAVKSIGAAIQIMGGTAEVWVAAGTYRESIRTEPGIALYGGFWGTEEGREERDWAVNETIIDAAGSDTPAVTGADDAILDGFTVTGGQQGGIFCYSSSPTLTNCTIAGNTAGIGGGVLCFYSSPTLTNCTIAGNTADDGGGVSCYDSSSPTLTNCTISGNTGGGVSCWNSSPTLTNCTITANTDGGVLCSRESSPNITNCILWNRGIEIDGAVTVEYSCIQEGWEGEGNISAYPLFVRPWDGESADLHLMPGSPCIDAGNPDPSYNDGCLPPGLGTERCDMGAYGGPGNCGWLGISQPVGVLEWMQY